jgi:putative membrane protein
MKIIWHWLLLSAALAATMYIFPGKIAFSPLYTVFIVGACLMFINMIIKPIISLLTLPINLLTLGLFSLVVNGLIFWVLAKFISGFTVAGFTAAFFGALVVAIINWLLEKVLK